jgi:uncharacterized protein (TIGR02117 family)
MAVRNSWVGRAIWGVVLALAALAMLIGSYVAAAAVGGAIPANPGWHQAESGVRIYVADNGIHTDLILPADVAGVRWDDLIRPEDLADPRMAAQSHLVFGWGDRDFYLNTPTWGDVSPWRVARAMAGAGRTVLHVAHAPAPRPANDIRAITLTQEEYQRLAAFVRATFATGTDGRVASVHGYGGYDAFYDAKGGYSVLNTCNAWTGAALRAAGVRVGTWTPLPFTVMQWF